jgi:ribosomal protein S18 acetylase RimI-like enzyme
MAEINIREAGEQDCQSLAGLFERHLKEQAQYDPLFKPAPGFSPEALVKLFFESGNHKFFVAQQEGGIVGFIRLNIFNGSQIVALQPASENQFWKRLTPLRIVRKMGATLLAWAEPKVSAPPVAQDYQAGLIADLYVLPDCRRQGWGTQLLEAAVQWFKQNSIEIIYLQAYNQNQVGMDFWRKHGFESFRMIMKKNLRGGK